MESGMWKVLEMIRILSTMSHPQVEEISRSELYCLSHAVYHEARGEPVEGQMAVAHSVLNRVEASRWPDTICEVVYQHKQYSHLTASTSVESDRIEWGEVVEVAAHAMVGYTDDPTNGADHFYAHKGDYGIPEPWWAPPMEYAGEFGNHLFLRSNPTSASATRERGVVTVTAQKGN